MPMRWMLDCKLLEESKVSEGQEKKVTVHGLLRPNKTTEQKHPKLTNPMAHPWYVMV